MGSEGLSQVLESHCLGLQAIYDLCFYRPVLGFGIKYHGCCRKPVHRLVRFASLSRLPKVQAKAGNRPVGGPGCHSN